MPLFYLLIVSLYAAVFAVVQTEPVPRAVYALAVLLFATCLLPLAVWYGRGHQGLPMFEMIALSYAVQFSMPIFTQYNGVLVLNQMILTDWAAVQAALALAQLGVTLLIVAYYWVQRLPVARRAPTLDLPFTPNRRQMYIGLGLAGGGGLLLLSTLEVEFLRSGPMGAITLLLTNQFYLAVILLAYQVYGPGSSSDPRLRTLLYAAVGGAFVLGMTTGLLENALLPVAMLLAVRWQMTRRFPWALVLAGGLLFLVLNTAKHEYRKQIWFGRQETTLASRVALWSDLAYNSATQLLRTESRQEVVDFMRPALARFDLIHKFAHVHAMTPEVVPYYQGDTYAYFMVAWIPRALWPGKPIATNSNHRMDVDYKLKYDFQTSTTIGIGLLAEGYANYGPWGVAAVMAIQGLLFGLLNMVLNGPRSDGGRAIYLSVMVYFLNGIGSSAAILFGALFQQVIANALILRLFTGRFQAERSTPAPKKTPPQNLRSSAREVRR